MFVIYRASYDVYYCENVYLLTREAIASSAAGAPPRSSLVFIVLYIVYKYTYVGTLHFCTDRAKRRRRAARDATHIIPHIRGLRMRSALLV